MAEKAMASSQDFQSGPSIYTPLDKTTRSIRLLRFIEPPPNCADNTLHFALTVHKLPAVDDNPDEDDPAARFIALSYVWGPPKPERYIIVNKKPIEIRENLHALLQVLHKPTQVANDDNLKAAQSRTELSEILRKNPYLWADAICIDQKAGEEKNHQVNMMGDIYDRAQFVVCWLGPHTAADKSKLAMDWLRKAGTEWSSMSVLEASVERALVALMNRPYWQRLWIVQEFALARRPLLLCGQSMVFLGTDHGKARIKTMGEWEWTHFREDQYIAASPVLYLRKSLDRDMGKSRNIRDIFTWIEEFRKQECERPHDRIFAMLALLDEDKPYWAKALPRMTADYSITLEQLFYRALAHCVDAPIKYGYRDMCSVRDVLRMPRHAVMGQDDTCVFVHHIVGLVHKAWGFCDVGEVPILEDLLGDDQMIDEVLSHLGRLTGLTRKDMLKDPEGTFLEVLGRLYYYPWADAHDWHIGGTPTSWEFFSNILRGSLSMPLTDYSDRYGSKWIFSGVAWYGWA